VPINTHTHNKSYVLFITGTFRIFFEAVNYSDLVHIYELLLLRNTMSSYQEINIASTMWACRFTFDI
jgi:hypothetical protein